MSFEWIVALVLLALALLLLIALLVRRPRVSLPPEWPERLQALEAAVQSTQLAVARNDGALAGMGEQLRAFTQTTQGMLDERLAQAREDARASRGELQAAFGHLQIHLEQLLTHARGEQTQALAAFRAELSATAQQLAADSVQSREGVPRAPRPWASVCRSASTRLPRPCAARSIRSRVTCTPSSARCRWR